MNKEKLAVRFPVGTLMCSKRANARLSLDELICVTGRHVSGDYGKVQGADAQANDAVVASGVGRVISIYDMAGAEVVVATDVATETTYVMHVADFKEPPTKEAALGECRLRIVK